MDVNSTQAEERMATDAGLLPSLRRALGTLIQHARLRLEVLQVEGREAALHLLLLAGLIAAAALLVLFAYLLLLLAAVFLLASSTGWSWAWVAVAVAGAHLLIALILLASVRQLSRRKLLTHSLEELKRDSTWLKKQASNKPTLPKAS